VTVAGRYQTGFPLNISQSSNNSNLLGSQQRPNLVEGVDVLTTGSQEERAITGWINPAAFSQAPAFTFGNVPRTNSDWRGPGQRTTDLAISQDGTRCGTKTLQLRVDVLNLFDDRCSSDQSPRSAPRTSARSAGGRFRPLDDSGQARLLDLRRVKRALQAAGRRIPTSAPFVSAL
jgi:hypothetical protein